MKNKAQILKRNHYCEKPPFCSARLDPPEKPDVCCRAGGKGLDKKAAEESLEVNGRGNEPRRPCGNLKAAAFYGLGGVCHRRW